MFASHRLGMRVMGLSSRTWINSISFSNPVVRGSKSFSSKELNATWSQQPPEEGKYHVTCVGLLNNHLPRLTAAELLHQVKFRNSHGSCLSFNTGDGHLHSTYHKQSYYFTRIILSAGALMLLSLYPLNWFLMNLSYKLIQSPNFLMRDIGSVVLEVLVQFDFNKRKLLDNNIGEALSVQITEQADAVRRGDINSWNSDTQKNALIVEALLSAEGASTELVKSGLYDALLYSYPFIKSRMNEEQKKKFFVILACLSDVTDGVPLHISHNSIFKDMLRTLYLAEDRESILSAVLVDYSTDPSKDKETNDMVLRCLQKLMLTGDDELTTLPAAQTWNNLSKTDLRTVFAREYIRALTFAVFHADSEEVLQEYASSMTRCAADRRCLDTLCGFDTLVFTVLKLSTLEKHKEDMENIIGKLKKTKQGNRIIQASMSDLQKSDYPEYKRLYKILEKQAAL